MTTKRGEVRSYFEEMMAKGDRSVCWPWPYYRYEGVGRMTIEGETVVVYAYAWRRLNGELPEGKELRHSCSQGSGGMHGCWNPEHVGPGSRQDNVRDMVNAGRHHRPAFKVPVERRQDLRRRASGGESERSLARAFGVTRTTVRKIKAGN